VGRPFNWVAGHCRLGGNRGANGWFRALGLCDDRGRAAWDAIGGWRCTELDGPCFSKVRQRDLVCLVVVVAQHRRSLGLLLAVWPLH
jgi:hypothetical protein